MKPSPHAFARALQAVQAEGVLALQDRRERCRGKRREEGREEAHPARVEGTHVRLLEAADLQLRGLVLRVHGARERPPVEVAPLREWTALQRAPLRCTCTSQLRRAPRTRKLTLAKRWNLRTVPGGRKTSTQLGNSAMQEKHQTLQRLANASAWHGTPPFPMVLLICSGASFWTDISICKPGALRRSPMRTGAGAIVSNTKKKQLDMSSILSAGLGASQGSSASEPEDGDTRTSPLAATAYKSPTTTLPTASGSLRRMLCSIYLEAQIRDRMSKLH